MKELIKKYEEKCNQIESIERKLRLSSYNSPKASPFSLQKHLKLKSELPFISPTNSQSKDSIRQYNSVDNKSFYISLNQSSRLNEAPKKKQSFIFPNQEEECEKNPQTAIKYQSRVSRERKKTYLLAPLRVTTNNDCEFQSYESQILVKPQKALIMERSLMFSRVSKIPHKKTQRMCNEIGKMEVQPKKRKNINTKKQLRQPSQKKGQPTLYSSIEKTRNETLEKEKNKVPQQSNPSDECCGSRRPDDRAKRSISPWKLEQIDEANEIWNLAKRK